MELRQGQSRIARRRKNARPNRHKCCYGNCRSYLEMFTTVDIGQGALLGRRLAAGFGR
jgi:hypothetical protein